MKRTGTTCSTLNCRDADMLLGFAFTMLMLTLSLFLCLLGLRAVVGLVGLTLSLRERWRFEKALRRAGI